MSRSDSGYGSGFSSTLWTTAKIDAFAPIASARVSMAVRVKSGARTSRRALHVLKGDRVRCRAARAPPDDRLARRRADRVAAPDDRIGPRLRIAPDSVAAPDHRVAPGDLTAPDDGRRPRGLIVRNGAAPDHRAAPDDGLIPAVIVAADLRPRRRRGGEPHRALRRRGV